MLCAAQAADLLSPLKTSEALQILHQRIRSYVPKMEKDRVISEDIASIVRIMETASFLRDIESELGHPL